MTHTNKPTQYSKEGDSPIILITGCSTCGRTLSVEPADTQFGSLPQLGNMVRQKLSNSTVTIGTYNKPVSIKFMHLVADVECLECHDTAQIEVRL